jgi:predicted regulator of Ras-like GTPase activity (Roadblock/LC7/MglB family)
MYRLLFAAFAVLLLIGTLVAAAPDLKFDGKIVAADKEKLVLLAGDQQQEFSLGATTKIMLNGKEAAASDLMAGQTAQVSADRDETKLRAVSIIAFSPK